MAAVVELALETACRRSADLARLEAEILKHLLHEELVEPDWTI
ncbi:MAG: hypothetical protein P4L98_12160 [Ancalomicrobiaceae bacterium]|nr:hypothetical protein [Ancalomicrobiaceae bacterium]